MRYSKNKTPTTVTTNLQYTKGVHIEYPQTKKIKLYESIFNNLPFNSILVNALVLYLFFFVSI